MPIENIDGLWWPVGDAECRPSVLSHFRDADVALKLCKKRRVAIQAGGNCGVWARHLSKKFDWVYTFEPDITNFLCLNLNAPMENIVRMQAAIGNEKQPIGMSLVKENIGAHHVGGVGQIPQLRIDDLNLPCVDFMQLDLEGYEYFALLGARETIKKHKPVLMIEDKRHHRKYGVGDADMGIFLAELGYIMHSKVARDIIMVAS